MFSQQYSLEQLLDDKGAIAQFKDGVKFAANVLSQKVATLNQNKSSIGQIRTNIQNQLCKHFEFIINNIIADSKREIEGELEKDLKKLEDRLSITIKQAVQLRVQFENELTNYDQLLAMNNDEVNNNNSSNSKSNNANYDSDFQEEDALMINDSVYEFSENGAEEPNGSKGASNHNNNLSKETRRQLLTEVQKIVNTLNSLSSENLLADNFLNESTVLTPDAMLRLVKCVPDFQGQCFGHLKKDLAIYTSVDQFDHARFHMDTPLSETFTYRKGEQGYIVFSCPDSNIGGDDKTALQDLLHVAVYDSQQNAVEFDLRAKLSPPQRIFRVYFAPKTAGIYSLTIKFKHVHITGSPFHFVVLDPSILGSAEPKPNAATVRPPQSSLHELVAMKKEATEFSSVDEAPPVKSKPTTPQRTVADKLAFNFDSVQRTPLEASILHSISVGRGRLMKEFNERKAKAALTSTTTSVEQPAVSQKRKTPTDANNNQDVTMLADDEAIDDDDSMRELSSKLKKVVCVDESVNKVHNYPSQSISTLMRLNVNTNGQSVSASPAAAGAETNPGANILSNHLRKYSSASNGLVRLIDDNIPPLRAQFQRKFANCHFPIGVRVCKRRNWLVVCDSGDNAVKIFERTSGALLHQIKPNPAKTPGGGFTLQRPSAVVINDENDEIYVKDDKEILVFDLENDCRFVRKFGFKILRKPYGLAFDSNGNLVLVNADLENPLIQTFDKSTGKLLMSKPYQPMIASCAQSAALTETFNQKGRILGTNLAPFEKTKVRFISYNQDHIYASDLGRSIVFKTNLEGETQLAFGNFGKNKGDLNEPSGIHVDSDGEAILVGDSKNDRLQVYDVNGKYKFNIEFVDDKIVRPSDIHVDSDGYLYVSCFITHCVKKFKFLVD